MKTHEERLTALKSLKEKGVITDADRAMLGLPLLRPLGKLPKGDQSSDTHNVRDMSYVSPEDIQARLVQGNNISPEEMLEMTKRMLDDAPEGSTQHKLLSDQLKFIQAKIDGDTDTVNSIAADNPEAPFLDFDGFDPTFQTGPTSAADIEKASSLLREKINSPLKALNALQRLLYTMTSSIERHNPNLSKLLFTRSGNGIKGAPDFSRDSRMMKETYEAMYGEAVKGESHESIKAGLEDAATGKPESEVGKRIHAVIESFSAEIRKSNPNYKMKGLPIVVDTAVVARDPKGFQRILVSHGIKEKMATKITEAYLNSSGVGDHKIHTDNTPNPFGGKGFTEMLRPAMKDLQDAGMIESDMGVKMQRFFTSGALYANWSKTFGATDKKGVFNENAVFEYHMSLIPPEHRLRIRKQVDHITGNINFGVPSWLHQMNSATFAFSAATLLLFSGIASIPEIGVVVGRSRGDISKLQNEVVKLFKKDGRMEVLEAADDFLTTTPYVVQETISSMFGRDAFTMGQGARRITDAMFRLNGQTFITDFTRRLATHAGRKFVESHAGKALQGNAESIRALAELGIDGATVDQFIAETMHNGGQVDINTPAGAAVRDAIHRFVDESVSNPYAAQMPTWMSDPRFQMIASLKKFYYAYWDNLHRQMFSEATKRRGSGGTISAAVAPMLLAGMIMLPLAGVAELLRELVKYPGEVLTFLPEWTKRMQPVETKDRLYSLIGAMGGAAIGQTAIAAYEQNGRGRNALTHLMGPTADFGWQFLSGDVLGKHPTRMMPILNQVAFARRPVDKTWRDWLRED